MVNGYEYICGKTDACRGRIEIKPQKVLKDAPSAIQLAIQRNFQLYFQSNEIGPYVESSPEAHGSSEIISTYVAMWPFFFCCSLLVVGLHGQASWHRSHRSQSPVDI